MKSRLHDRYKVAFRFTKKINKLTFQNQGEQMTAEEREVMQKTLG